MRRSGAVTVLLAGLALLVTGGPLPRSAAAQPDDPAYFWRWSDGREQAARLIHTAPPHGIPSLVVATAPTTPGKRVLLQFRDGTRWRTEDAARTGSDGTATLSLNPFCEDGDWCRQTFDYRLVAGGRTAGLTVTFR